MAETLTAPAAPTFADAATDTLGEGFDLRQIVAVIRTHLYWIIGVMVASVVLGLLLTMLQTRQYTAVSTVQIDDVGAQILRSGQDLEGPMGAYDTDRFLNTQLDVLKSKALARRVADRLKLYGNQRFIAAMGGSPSAASGSRERIETRTVSMLRSHLSVTLPRQSRIASIAIVSSDQNLSAQIANAYADEFIQSNLQRKFESSDYARQFVAQQMASAKQRLEESERQLNSYARSAGLIRTRDAASTAEGGGGQTSITSTSLVELNSAANEAKARRIEAEARWRAVANVPGLASKEVLSNNTVQNLLTRKAEIEADLRQERSRHLDEHPNVIKLVAQMSAVDQQLANVVSGVRKSIEQEYRAAQAAEQSLAQQVNQLKSDTLGEQDRSVGYSVLAREADTNRTLYDGLLQRYKELTAASGIASSNIALIDRAEVPSSPSSPNLLINLAYAIFAGLAISALLVFVRLQLDDAVRVPEDVEHKLSLPVLGIVPKLREGDTFDQLSDPKSSMSEAYNSLRGAISFTTNEGPPRLLLVTSASAGEGKSTTSYALARGFAKLGRRVLLVDVDMRRPSTHRQFGVENDIGLSNLLVGQAGLEQVIRPTEFENLSIVTSGPIPPSPTELLASKRMQDLLAAARSQYDMVVLDSPPILGLADSPLLSSFADGTLLVLESDRNRRGVLKGTLRRVRLAKGRVIGVAMTKFDASHASSYTYYYGYGYDYYAYEGGERRQSKRRLLDRFGRKRSDPEAVDA